MKKSQLVRIPLTTTRNPSTTPQFCPIQVLLCVRLNPGETNDSLESPLTLRMDPPSTTSPSHSIPTRSNRPLPFRHQSTWMFAANSSVGQLQLAPFEWA